MVFPNHRNVIGSLQTTIALVLSSTQGFWKSQAYIATQYPLEETTQDFWRMVWQENCRSLVMLLSKAELEQVMFRFLDGLAPVMFHCGSLCLCFI